MSGRTRPRHSTTRRASTQAPSRGFVPAEPSRRDKREVRRRWLAAAPDAHLDDLLRFDDAGPPLPLPGAARPWVLRSALQSFLASAVLYTFMQVVDLRPPYPLVLALCTGIVLLRRAVLAGAEPAWLRTAAVVKTPTGPRHIGPGGWYQGGDGMISAIRRWDLRMDWGASSAERFDHTVRARLVEVADERLRQRHGLTLFGDPARARRLLGEPAWQLLAGPLTKVPTNREVSQLVDQLEKL